MEYKEITKNDLYNLLDNETIQFENDGIKAAFTEGMDIIKNNKIDVFVKENNLSEENIITSPFSQENIVFENLTEKEKKLYIEYWLKRMIFFYQVDYMWNKDTLEDVSFLEINTNKIDINSNVENLLSKKNIFIPSKIVNKIKKLKNNNTKIINTDELEKYHTVKYSIEIPNLSLISSIKNDDDYFREIKKIDNETNLSNIISCVKNLLKLEDLNLLRIIESLENERDELSEETDINIIMKSINRSFETDSSKLFEFSDYNPQLYQSVFNHTIKYRGDNKHEADLEILNDLFERYYNIVLRYNMGLKATDNENEKIIVINEKNRVKQRSMILGIIENVVGGFEFIPDLTYQIDPALDDKVFRKGTSIYEYNGNFSVIREGESVTITSNRKTKLLKNTVIDALNFIGSEYILNSRWKNLNTFNGPSKENEAIMRFSLLSDMVEKHVLKNESKELQDRFKLRMLCLQASVFTQSFPDIYKFHLHQLKNLEYISKLDKMDMKKKLYHFLFNENYTIDLVDLIVEKDIKKQVNVKGFAYFPYSSFSQQMNNVSNEWLQLIIDKSNWSMSKIAENVDISENIIKEFFDNRRKEIMSSIVDSNNLLEDMKIKPETVEHILKFKETDYTGFMATHDKSDILKAINKSLLTTMMEMNISEATINDFIKDNDRVEINGKNVIQYFINKKELSTENIDSFDADYWVSDNQKKEVINVLADIVKLEKKPLFNKSNILKEVHNMLCNAFLLKVFTDQEQIFLLEKFYTKKYFDKDIGDDYVYKFLNLQLSEKVLKVFIKSNVKLVTDQMTFFSNFFVDLKQFSLNYKEFDVLDFCKQELHSLIKDYHLPYEKKTVDEIINLLDNTNEKIDFFIEMMVKVKNKRKGYRIVELKDYTNLFDVNNKRLFKLILKKFNEELVNIKNTFEEDLKDANIKGKYESEEKESPVEVLTVKLKVLNSIIQHFSKKFVEEKDWVNTVINFSKLLGDLHNSFNVNIEKDEKSLIGVLYWKLPEDLAQLAVDKLDQGKLLHQLMGEINLVKYMDDKAQEKVQVKKRKI